MCDALNVSDEELDLRVECCIKRAHKLGSTIVPNGRCYSCKELLEGINLLYCDKECCKAHSDKLKVTKCNYCK